MAQGLTKRAQAAVIPVAAGGPDLATSIGQLWDAPVHRAPDAAGWCVRRAGQLLLGWQQEPVADWAPRATSQGLGEWLRDTLTNSDEQLILDLTGVSAHDGGRGLLSAAGDALAGRELIGLVSADELARPATGIGGTLALRAFAAGLDVADLVTADAALVQWADRLGAGLATAPGGGAAGACGLAILASGGRLESATQFCHSEAGLGRTLATADLVLTGCTELSALDRGGPVVAAVSEWAEAVQRPCVVLTPGRVLSSRELRTFGIEVARQVPAGMPLAHGLELAAARIATTWLSAPGVADLD